MHKNPAIQFASGDQNEVWSETRLRDELRYLHERSPFYRELFHREKIDPALIRRVEDMQQLPVTTNDDLQKHSEAFFCVPKR